MFVSAIFPDGKCDLIDFTGDKTDDVVVEMMKSPAGHDVLYVSSGGKTLFRLCRPKSMTFSDQRPNLNKKVRKKCSSTR